MKHIYLKIPGILVLLFSNYVAFSQNQIQRTTDPFIMAMGAFPGRMVVGDFDKDGDADILYQNGNTVGVGIGFFKNNGGGVYQDFPNASAAGSPFAGFSFTGENISPTALFVWDYDNDGDMDILDRDPDLAGDPATTMGIWRNENGTSFTELAIPFTTPAAWNMFYGRMITGDFDNDGDKDILFQAGNTIGVGFGYIRNNGGGSFTTFDNANSAGTPFTTFVFTNQQMTALTVLDYDNDGDADIIDRDDLGGGALGVWKNNSGVFAYDAGPFTTLDNAPFYNRMVFGDFDSDGDQDALFQKGNTISTGFGYASNNGNGVFTISADATTAPGPFNGFDFTNEQMTSLFVFDYDNDVDVDIIDRDNLSGGQLGVWRQVGPPPTLIATSPLDNATNVAPTANIVLTFSETVTKNTGNIYLYNVGTNSIVTTMAVGNALVTTTDNISWTIDFPGNFTTNVNYAIRMDAGIFKDVDNRTTAAITDNTTFNFFVPAAPPAITNLNGDAATFTEGGGPVKLDVGGNAIAADNLPDFNGATLTVTFTANSVNGQDLLSVENQGTGAGQIGIAAGNVTYGGVTFATTTGGTAPAPLTFTMNANASYAAVTGLLRALTYANNSDNSDGNTRSVSIVLTDSEAATATVNVTVNITRVNNPPVLTVPANVTVNEDENKLLTGISFTDADGATGAARISFLTAVGTFTANAVAGITITGNNTTNLILDGTYTALNNYLSGASNVAFSFAANQSSNVVIDVLVSDLGNTGGGAQTVSGIIQILGKEVNDRPAITAPASINVTEDVLSVLKGFSFSDIDAGGSLVDVTLSTGSGTISAMPMAGITITPVSANEVKLTGTLTALNNYITGDNVGYTTALHNTANVTLTITINDGGFTGDDPGTSGTPTTEETSTTVTLIVAAVNDAPSINSPASYAVTEKIAKTIDGITLIDVDDGTSNTAQAVLTVSFGTLHANTGAGVTVTGSGTGTLTLTGLRSDINAFITAGNIQYNVANTQTTDATLNLSFNDAGDSGSGGPLVALSPAIPINVTFVNDRPTITVPASINVQEDVLSALAGYSFDDIDVAGGAVDVTLSVLSGTLTATPAAGITITTVSPGEVILESTITAINSYIAASSIGFTTALNNTANVTLRIKVNDRGNTGTDPGISGTATSEESIADVALMVIAVNDAPAISTSLDQSTPMNITKALSPISISDVDAGGGQLKMQLEASTGSLSLSGIAGLTFTTGDGTADAIMEFTGTIANINAALNGVTCIPPAGFVGDINISLKIDDQGNTGGAALSETKTVLLHVLPTTPVVLQVSSSTSNGTYKLGDAIEIAVTFDQPVNVTGNPTITLETGTTDRTADYTSGSGTNTLFFNYTVQSGDLSDDLDYTATNALTLNGGTIQNGSLLNAELMLPATASANSIAGNSALIVDGVAPFITGVEVPANATYVAGQQLDFLVYFSEVMTVTGNNSSITVQLESGPVQAVYVLGSGSSTLEYRYVVATDNLDTDGITLGSLVLNGATIQDDAGNDALLALNGVPVTTGIKVDAAAPVITSVTVPANKIWKAGESLDFTVHFIEAVIKTGVANPSIGLTIGANPKQLAYVSGSGTNAHLYRYTVIAGDLDRNGIEISSSITLNGSTLKDAAGNDAKTIINNPGSLLNVWVDAVAPQVTAGQVFSIAENSAAGTAVGTVQGTDPGSTNTLQQWSITSNVNPDGDGNPAFAINVATGAVTVNDAGDLNFEATASLTISVTVSDGVNTSAVQTVLINLTNAPEPPLDIALSNNTILENNAANAQVGLLSATSSETGTTFTYTLAAGGADNSAFTISGNSLRAVAAFNAEAKSAYNIRIRATTQAGEFLEKAFVITVTNVNEAPTLDVITNRALCATTNEVVIPLTGITPGPETTQSTTVTVNSNNAALFSQLTADNTAVRLRFVAGANGSATITVTVKDNGGTANGGIDQVVRTFNVSVTTIAAPAITSDKGTKISKGDFAALTATGGVSYVWDNSPGIISGQNSNVLNIRPQENATYRVTASNAAGCTASAQISIEVVNDYKVNSANIMTPNGDGINDRFVIRNIDSYPGNEVKIFDRSGRLIYSKRGYQNEWDGKVNGKALEEGTYYFLLDFGAGLPKVKGFITIIREK